MNATPIAQAAVIQMMKEEENQEYTVLFSAQIGEASLFMLQREDTEHGTCLLAAITAPMAYAKAHSVLWDFMNPIECGRDENSPYAFFHDSDIWEQDEDGFAEAFTAFHDLYRDAVTAHLETI